MQPQVPGDSIWPVPDHPYAIGNIPLQPTPSPLDIIAGLPPAPEVELPPLQDISGFVFPEDFSLFCPIDKVPELIQRRLGHPQVEFEPGGYYG